MIVMDELGPNLMQLLESKGGKFSLKTTCMLAIQMIERVKQLHSRNILHNNIKPEHFCMGIHYNEDKSGIVHLLDFALAQVYKNKEKGHRPLQEGQKCRAPARYASLNNSNGLTPSRRDDLESLCFIWIQFLKGSLPW